MILFCFRRVRSSMQTKRIRIRFVRQGVGAGTLWWEQISNSPRNRITPTPQMTKQMPCQSWIEESRTLGDKFPVRLSVNAMRKWCDNQSKKFAKTSHRTERVCKECVAYKISDTFRRIGHRWMPMIMCDQTKAHLVFALLVLQVPIARIRLIQVAIQWISINMPCGAFTRLSHAYFRFDFIYGTWQQSCRKFSRLAPKWQNYADARGGRDIHLGDINRYVSTRRRILRALAPCIGYCPSRCSVSLAAA